jgi:multidrug efflux pump subunit AcrB
MPRMPFTDHAPAMKWDGEWHITIEVFRDLGTAFAACAGPDLRADGWLVPVVPDPLMVMMAIPFSLVGILPAHG